MLIVVFLCIAVGSIFPNSVYAQSEEDILNSIGAELESEAEKKEAEEKKEKEYESLKSKADGYMKGEKYDKARETFKAMSKIFPDRDYPTRQIRLADQLEEKAKMAEKQEQYDKLMADADNLFSKDKLAEAKTAYENASKVLPDEALPKEKIKVIAKKMAEAEAAKKAAELKQKYDAKVAEADKAFSSSNWTQATQLYKAALSIKSDESYPTEQLKQIEVKKKEEEERKQQEALDSKYQAILKEADDLLSSKKWDDAKEKYSAASRLKPNEAYPKEKIAEADQLKKQEEEQKAQAALDEKYNRIVEEADDLLKNQKFDDAIAKYQEASKVKPSESYPKTQIDVAKQQKTAAAEQAAQAEKQAQYDGIIKEADDLLKNEQFDQAIAKYEEAKGVLPSESYPQEQITKANEQKAAKAQGELQAQYDGIIKEADDLLKNQQFDDAIAKYQEASKVKPDESYPKTQIDVAKQQKTAAAEEAAQAEKQAQYDGIIKEADDLLKNEQFDQAIVKYEEAKGVLPSESYPQEQITKANEQKAAKAQGELQAQYDGIIKEADDLLKSEQFDQAIAKYEEAKGVLPSESYPQEQITKANELKAAKAQGELQAQYDGIIKEADDFLKSEQFDQAIAKYEEAKGVLPSESYPQEQITKANEQKAAKAQGELQAQYDGIIKEADDFLKSEQFDQAISKYEEAKRILPTENYPAEQITKANELKAAAASQKEQAEKQAEYETIIAGADELFNSGDFEGSIAKYQEAQAVLPNETYPQEQIAKANEGLTQLQNQKAEAEQLEAAYATAMETGTAAMTSEDFAGAIAAFKEATKLKKDSQEAKDKLQEAEIALQQFESQQKAADKAAKEEEKKREEYNEIITKADAEFAAGEFTSAISMYKQAQTLFPEEAYPGTQIAAADAAIAEKELAAQKEREAEAAAKDAEEKQYQDLLTQGDQAKDNQEYQAAIGFYQQAAALKPDAEIPATKIETVNTLIAQAEEEQRLAAEKEAELAAKNKEFDNKIAQGNQALERNEFTEAISLFNQAKSIDPNSTIPADRIAKAEEAMQAAADAEEQAELAEQERLEAIEEQYSSLIGEAELLVQQKNYFDAIAKFEEAKAVKPTAMGPQERIDHVRRLIRKEEEEKRKAEEAIQAQQQLEQGFKKALEEGDAALAANDFVKAKNAYRRAQQLKLDDPVPTEKLAKAEELQAAYEAAEAERKAQEEAERKAAAEAQAKAEQQQKAYDEAIEEANRFFNAKEYDQAAAGYLKASDIKPEMEYPKSQLAEIARLRKEQEAEQAKQREIAQKKREAEEAARKKAEEERKKKAAEAKKAAEERANKAREDRIKRYQELQPEALAAKYPSGISHEEYDDGQRKVKKSTIVENGQGRQLMRYKYPWGAEFFFLNGKQITKDAYYWNMRKYR